MDRAKNIIIMLIQFLLIPLIAFAAGKAFPSSSNQTLTTIAGVKADGTIVGLLVGDDGTVQMNCIP